MNIVGFPLTQGALLTNSAVTYYTSTNIRTRLDKVTIANPTGSNRTVTMYKIGSGGSASAATTISYQKSVLAGQTIDVTELEGHWLGPGDFVQALADAGSDVSLMMSGIQTPQ